MRLLVYSETFALVALSNWKSGIIILAQSMPFGEIMVWKNLKQRSLADSMLIDHDAVKELDSVHKIIDWAGLEHHRKYTFKCSRREGMAATDDV